MKQKFWVWALIGALSCVGVVNAHADTQVDKTATKQEKIDKKAMEKRIQAMRDSVSFVRAVEAIKNHDFVLEADRLVFKRGETAYVSSGTNFVSLKGDEAVVQVAPFNVGGPNGVGGVTVEGRASDMELKTDKNGNVFFSMNVLGSGISASVYLSLPVGGNNATVTVDPNFSSNRITLSGTLLPTEQSSVYQGRSF